MSASIIDGKAIAALVRASVRSKVPELAARGLKPGLAVVLVGDDPASHVYVANKDKAALEAGFVARTLRLPASTAQSELEARVCELNSDRSVHGILVQMPLPRHLDAARVIALVDPAKDVDGLHPDNVAALVLGRPGLRPCTPLGVLELLDRSDVNLEGRDTLVIGRSELVGKPFAQLALQRNATVTIAHSKTRDLEAHVRRAEVVVAAAGRAGLVRGAWIRPGAIVIDVGIHRSSSGRLEGDVEFDAARERAGAITPVPGGVGPMTIAMLLSNTLLAATNRAGVDVAVSTR